MEPNTDESGAPLVLVLLSTVQKARRDKLLGIYRYAQNHGWRLRVIENHPFGPRLPRKWTSRRPDGVIADGTAPLPGVGSRLLAGIPTVYLDHGPGRRRVFRVDNDAAETGGAAARVLLRLGLDNYAFVGSEPDTRWSRDREAAFAAAVRADGKKCFRYRAAKTGWNRDRKNLARWLDGLPKPCGVFAAMDLRAQQILELCRENGIAVPGQLAVLGVDNDEPVCESSRPTLSSVLPDFEGAGGRAARLLDRLLRTPGLPPVVETYGVARVCLRQSTRRLAGHPRDIDRLLEYIRLNACTGISAADVARQLNCSRRSAEQRFRAATGTSILAEIQRVRFEKVCHLLTRTRDPIGLIAASCGYRSDIHLKNLFKLRTGLSMREYRHRHSSL